MCVWCVTVTTCSNDSLICVTPCDTSPVPGELAGDEPEPATSWTPCACAAAPGFGTGAGSGQVVRVRLGEQIAYMVCLLRSRMQQPSEAKTPCHFELSAPGNHSYIYPYQARHSEPGRQNVASALHHLGPSLLSRAIAFERKCHDRPW